MLSFADMRLQIMHIDQCVIGIWISALSSQGKVEQAKQVSISGTRINIYMQSPILWAPAYTHIWAPAYTHIWAHGQIHQYTWICT